MKEPVYYQPLTIEDIEQVTKLLNEIDSQRQERTDFETFYFRRGVQLHPAKSYIQIITIG